MTLIMPRLSGPTVEAAVGAVGGHRWRVGHRSAFSAGVGAVMVNLARTDLRPDEYSAAA
ncbi:hypothetical protein [Rhodococcus sp. Leaf278]|uniref:hypothetical protein n=1 Tax=Rhodococcus sp. Leaf278 TaxID=1736319 RepID=UPI000AE153EE|nr:hypothetical protein [Rhodococcus sp. Leaf278]